MGTSKKAKVLELYLLFTTYLANTIFAWELLDNWKLTVVYATVSKEKKPTGFRKHSCTSMAMSSQLAPHRKTLP